MLLSVSNSLSPVTNVYSNIKISGEAKFIIYTLVEKYVIIIIVNNSNSNFIICVK